MYSVREKVMSFIRDEEGLTTVEYAVAGGLIAAVVVATFVALGGTVCTVIAYINDQLLTGPAGGVASPGC